MRFLFIRVEKASYPVTVLCRVLEVARSGYYAFEKRGPSPRAKAQVALLAKIRVVCKAGRDEYGSPRVHEKLTTAGEKVSVNCVARLMRENGIKAVQKPTFCPTTDSGHGLPVAGNLLNRQFTVEAPNRVWVTDMTYIGTREGWLYVAVILDLFSRRVVGLAMSDSIDRCLALDALGDAVRLRRPPFGLLHHSDQGSPYASADYQGALTAHGMRCSMSRRGNCWDNAVAESFFRTLKNGLIREGYFDTRARAAAAVREYVECFYNVERLHSTLGYVSPIEYELRARLNKEAA